MPTDSLRPCPFCGSTHIREVFAMVGKDNFHSLQCVDCWANSGAGHNKEAAKELWNTRFHEAGLPVPYTLT